MDARKNKTISSKSTTDSIKSQGSPTKEYDLEDDDTSNDSNSNYDENQLGMQKTLVRTLMKTREKILNRKTTPKVIARLI